MQLSVHCKRPHLAFGLKLTGVCYLKITCIFLKRGVFAKENLEAQQFIVDVEYSGDVISDSKGQRRENIQQTGFRYFFSSWEKYWLVY